MALHHIPIRRHPGSSNDRLSLREAATILVQQIFGPEATLEISPGIHIGPTDTDLYSWSTLSGLSLKTRNASFKMIHRRVMAKNGMIDGDKVIAKVEELKTLRSKELQIRKKQRARANERYRAFLELRDRLHHPSDVYTQGDFFGVYYRILTAEQVVRLDALYHEMREEDNNS